MSTRPMRPVASYSGGVPSRVDTPWPSGGLMTPGGIGYMSYGDSFTQMRWRAQQLERNNVLASAVLDRATDNVIGTGFGLQPRSLSEEFNARAAELWGEWTSGVNADIRGMFTWGKLQRLIYRSRLRDGDVGVVLVDLNTTEDPRQSRPKLQVIEGEMIDGGIVGTPARRNVVDGVELDRTGLPVRFYIRSTDATGLAEKTEPVEARDFIFYPRLSRYRHVRGEPALHATYTLFDNIMGYLDAAVMASRVGANAAMVVTDDSEQDPEDEFELDEPNDEERATGKGPPLPDRILMEPAQLLMLRGGKRATAFNPSQPQQNMPDAIMMFVAFVAVKFGLPAEKVLLWFKDANYSRSRAIELQARITAEDEQDDFNAVWLQRVYRWFISKMIKAGRFEGINLPANAWHYEYLPPNRPLVDPKVDLEAFKLALELGVDTRSYWCAERGMRFPDVVNQNTEDEKLRRGSLAAEETQRSRLETYGVAVRAGVITPQLSDEEHMRRELGLPPLSPEAKSAWGKGVRKPVTLQAEDDAAPTGDASEGSEVANAAE